MKSPENPAASDPVAAVESTLRMIANLPAPEGLAERVQVRLWSAPPTARVLSWPAMRSSASQWMRGAAAAAIVGVVAGGGWTICTRVQPSPSVRVLALPAQDAPSSGFSSAGAKRVPNTLAGPVLTHAVTPGPQSASEPAKPVTPAPTHKKASKLHKPASAITAAH